MKKIRTITAFVCAAVTMAAASSALAVGVDINDTKIYFDVPPVIINGRTMVPMRAIFEVLGADIEWDGSTQTVTAERGNDKIALTIGSPAITVNGSSKALDTAPVLVSDRALVPVRAISEALGSTVVWNENSQTVEITDNSGLIKLENADKYKTVSVLEVTTSPTKYVNVMYDIDLDGTEENIAFWITEPQEVNGMFDPAYIMMSIDGDEHKVIGSTALSQIREIYIADSDVTDNAKEIVVIHDCDYGATILKYEKGVYSEISLKDFRKNYKDYSNLVKSAY